MPDQDPGVAFAFEGLLFYWRGPAPFYFVRVPPDQVEELADVAAEVTYGWGMVPVEVTVGGYTWDTSLWPKDGGYLVPIRAKVRRDLGIEVDESVAVRLTIAPRSHRPLDPSTRAPQRKNIRKDGGQ